MVRKTLSAGNWKMNGLLEDGGALAIGVKEEFKKAGETAKFWFVRLLHC